MATGVEQPHDDPCNGRDRAIRQSSASSLNSFEYTRIMLPRPVVSLDPGACSGRCESVHAALGVEHYSVVSRRCLKADIAFGHVVRYG